jgi:hypothetical protein
MVSVKYDEISAAFAFVSFAAPMEHQAYVCLETGAIYWVSELNPLEEEVPDDLGESGRYIAMPDRTTWIWEAISRCASHQRNCRGNTRGSRTSFGIGVPTLASKPCWRPRVAPRPRITQ